MPRLQLSWKPETWCVARIQLQGKPIPRFQVLRRVAFSPASPEVGLWSEEQHRRWLTSPPFMTDFFWWGAGPWCEGSSASRWLGSRGNWRFLSWMLEAVNITGPAPRCLSPDTAHLWPRGVMLRGRVFMERHLSSSFFPLLSHSINFLRERSDVSSIFKSNQALSLRHEQVAVQCALHSKLPQLQI